MIAKHHDRASADPLRPGCAHTLVEDIFGIANGCLLISLGLHLLHRCG
jgi:hypothetical protein